MYFLIKSKRICVAPATFKYRQPCEMSREDWSPPPLASSPHHTLGARDRSSQHANTNMAITNIKRHGRIKKKKKEEQESPLGVGWSGCKILLCLAFKGYLPELLIHLINQGTAQAKELPWGCQDSPTTPVPPRPLCYHSAPKFFSDLQH